MKDSAEALVGRLSKKFGNDRTDNPEIRQYSVANAERSGALAVKTPGGGFVLTRFLLPFHRLEKEEPVLLKDRNCKKSCCLCLKQSGSGKRDLIAKIRNAIGISIERIFCLAGNDKFIFFSTYDLFSSILFSRYNLQPIRFLLRTIPLYILNNFYYKEKVRE